MFAGGLTDRHLVLGAVSVMIVLGVAGALLAPGSPGAAMPSSLSASAQGGKAAFETLRALGYTMDRSYEPMASLRADPATTTLVISGAVAPSDQDRRALLAFLEAGGEVLVVGQHGAAFLGVDGASSPPLRPDQPVVHRVIVPSPLTSGVAEVTMIGDAGVPKFAPTYVALFAVDADRPLVVTGRIGAGRAAWWASPTPLANAHIGEADNLRLLLNVAGDPGARRVLWDEHYHGHSRTLWSYLVQTPLPWAGAQVVLVGLAAIATFSRRRGPVRAPRADGRTSPLEFIDMLGALYARAGAHRAAVAAALTRLTRAATVATGVPHDSSDDVIARAVASRTGVDPADVSARLAGARRAQHDPAVDPAAAIEIVSQLQRLTTDLKTAGRPPRVDPDPGRLRRQTSVERPG